MNNLELWNKVKQPPPTALKQIKGGRLSGMTDISPQWRYLALTEEYGACGIGWNYEIVRLWQEKFDNGEVMAFAEIKLNAGESKNIPGIGGSKLVTMESKGLHYSDEGYKMAVTDALGVAAKMLGFGADIYMGKWDGSKYKDTPQPKEQTPMQSPEDLEKEMNTVLSAASIMTTEKQLTILWNNNKKFHGQPSFVKKIGEYGANVKAQPKTESGKTPKDLFNEKGELTDAK